MTKVKLDKTTPDENRTVRNKRKAAATPQALDQSKSIQVTENSNSKRGNKNNNNVNKNENNIDSKERQCVVKVARYNMRKLSPNKERNAHGKEHLAATRAPSKRCSKLAKDSELVPDSELEHNNNDQQNDENTLVRKPSEPASNLNTEKLGVVTTMNDSDNEVVLPSPAATDKLNLASVRKTIRQNLAFTSTPLNGKSLYPFGFVDNEARKNLKKLSLTNRKLETYEGNDISSFNPPRNSTILRTETLNANKNNPIDAGKEIGNNRSRDNLDNSNKSLTGKTDLIADILDSLDDDQQENEVNVPDIDNPKETVNQKSQSPIKTNKFFHRSKTTSANEKHDFRAPSYRMAKTKATTSLQRKSDVYNMSLSENSDSDGKKSRDPTADVVRKLIRNGKAVLASRQNGKNILSRKAPLKRCNKTTQKVRNIVDNNVKTRKMQIAPKKVVNFRVNSNKSPLESISTIMEVEEGNPNVQAHNVSNLTEVNENQQQTEGSFNNLARSSLLNQTGIKKISHQRQLLEEARRIVMGNSHKSSPVVSGELQMTNLSPIPNRSLTRFSISKSERLPNDSQYKVPSLGNGSPWRVGNESVLPSCFHFSRGSDNLPSYSSSYIPPTPQKPKKYVNKFASLGRTSPMKGLDDEPIEDEFLASENCLSLNDSNAENQPPPTHESRNGDLIQENENIFNSRNLPNPRRTIPNRSPLKAINIQEVLVLPAWKNPAPEMDKSSSEENVGLPKRSPSKRVSASNSKSQGNLFGFEDYFEGATIVDKVHEKTLKSNPNDKTTREKLLALKKWHPKEPDLKTINENKITKNIFEKPLQKRINEIFCSTMIHSPSANKPVPEDSGSMRLFEDLDPELTFDEKKPRRTYLKPKQKKRKVRHNFVLFMDSDLSEEEQESDSNEKLNESLQENKRKKVKVKEKRHKNEVKDTIELKNFVKNFNEICKEVEDYEIPVE